MQLRARKWDTVTCLTLALVRMKFDNFRSVRMINLIIIKEESDILFIWTFSQMKLLHKLHFRGMPRTFIRGSLLQYTSIRGQRIESQKVRL